MSFLEAPWLLLLVPLLARLVSGERNGDDPWRTRVDVPLALASGVGVAALCAFWLARYHLKGWPLTASDFAQYCQSVASMQAGTMAYWVPQRSVGAGLAAALMSRELGVLGGLIASTLLSQAVIGTAVYLWGRAAHGRVAGVASAILVGAVAPLVVLSRTVTFYPPFIAACAVCSAGAMLAVRFRTLPALFAGGLGASLVLLADVRGLYWALAGLTITLIGAVPPYLGRLPRRLLVVFAPVVASWFVGRALLLPDTPGLDSQLQIYVADAVQRTSGAAVDLPPIPADDFVWGRSSPLAIPGALVRMAELTQLLPAELAQTVEVAHNRSAHLTPWLGLVAVSVLLWVLRMRLRPWTMLAFLLSLGPYALTFWSTATTLAHARYLALAMLAIPVALGVPLGAFIGAPSPLKVAAPLLGLLLVLVLGVVPSWLSPVASWREPFNAELEPQVFQLQAVGMQAANAQCVVALARDRYRGRDWDPYSYPVELPALPNISPTGELIVPNAAAGGGAAPMMVGPAGEMLGAPMPAAPAAPAPVPPP